MLHLTTLGGVAVARDGVPLPWLQRGWQRAALFALLAAAGKRGIDRDALATLLWPDSNDVAAKHSLDELLSRARRELDCKQLFTATSSIAFNADFISIDVEHVQLAASNQDHERVAELFGGPFADGLRLFDADECERRIHATRVRLDDLHTTSLTRLAERCTARGDHAAAVTWWSKAVLADRLSMQQNQGLLNALINAGERARALAHLRIFRALLEDELGISEDASLAEIEFRATSLSASTSEARAASGQSGLAPTAVPKPDSRLAAIAAEIAEGYLIGAAIEESTHIATYELAGRNGTGVAELNLLRRMFRESGSRARFVEAFRRVAAISHPNIVSVISSGIAEDSGYWISTKRARTTLRDVLRRRNALSVAECVETLNLIAQGMRFAHEMSVYHGDLRPKRIVVDGPRILVAGFGVLEALLDNSQNDAGRSTISAIGSPQYQSPEQLYERAGADAQSDIYAFGCIAYELLSGESPFGKDPGISMVRRKLAGDVRALRELRSTVPQSIEAAVMQCLAVMPGDRGRAVPLLEMR